MSRDKILQNISSNQPPAKPLPDLEFQHEESGIKEIYVEVLKKIGGKLFEVKSWDEIRSIITESFPAGARKITTINELSDIADTVQWKTQDPHALHDVEAAVIRAHFGVAENGALWITDELIFQQVVPFITQHLLVVLPASEIVPTMHQAYQRIGNVDYNFGVFIAGPSKTADIEQSLVLGAHGPRTMTVFLLNEQP